MTPVRAGKGKMMMANPEHADIQTPQKRAKAHLSNIRKTESLIQCLCQTRFSLRSSLYSAGAVLSGASGGHGDADRTGKILGQIESLESKIDRYIDKLIELKQDVFEKIQRIENADEQEILIARYLQFYAWDKISAQMHYELRQVYRIHGRALASFADVMDKDADL